MAAMTDNPFAGIDWAGQQVASLSHAHVFQPTNTGVTCAQYLQTIIDSGYRHIAISNYYPSDPASSYPLTNLPGVTAAMIPDDVIASPNAEHFGFSNTDGPGHICTPGSLFATGTGDSNGGATGGSGFGGPWQSFVDQAIAGLQYSDGGGIVIEHPDVSSYVGERIAKAMLDYSPLVLGQNIYDFSVDWSPDFGSNDGLALDKWHDMLVGGRRCYGYAVPDHWLESSGAPPVPRGANRLMVPASYAAADKPGREHLCLKAYRNGESYGVLSLPDSPVLSGVAVTATEMTVSFAQPCDITFYFGQYGDTAARASATVHGTSATYTFTGAEIYVRAEGQGATQYARSFTQPVMFEPPFKPIDPMVAMAVLG